MDREVEDYGGDNYTESHHVRDLEDKVSLGLILTTIDLFTICGNVLVLLSVSINRTLRSVTNSFVVNLAFADLLLGLLVLPFSTVLQLEKRWIFGRTFCDVWASVDVLCCTASILSLCAISIDRYIGVTRPLRHRSIMTRKRTTVVIVSLWILSFAISLGPLLGWRDKQNDPFSCAVTTKPGYVIFSALCSFYIPASVLIIIYARIYKEARLQVKSLKNGFKQPKTKPLGSDNGTRHTTLRLITKRNLLSRANSDSKQPKPASGNEPPAEPVQPAPVVRRSGSKLRRLGQQMSVGSRISKFNKERKAAKTLGIVVGVFLLCWFPFFFLLPLASLCSKCNVSSAMFDVAFWLGYCNSLANPIIYATWNKEFRKTFICLLKCQVNKQKGHVVSYLAKLSAQQIAQTATDRRTLTVPCTDNNPLTSMPKWTGSITKTYEMELAVNARQSCDQKVVRV